MRDILVKVVSETSEGRLVPGYVPGEAGVGVWTIGPLEVAYRSVALLDYADVDVGADAGHDLPR